MFPLSITRRPAMLPSNLQKKGRSDGHRHEKLARLDQRNAPRPLHSFHVIGEVFVGNPGVDVFLTPKEPQGINPQIFLMDLHKFQRPGIWPQHTTWVATRYERILGPNDPKYTDVE